MSMKLMALVVGSCLLDEMPGLLEWNKDKEHWGTTDLERELESLSCWYNPNGSRKKRLYYEVVDIDYNATVPHIVNGIEDDNKRPITLLRHSQDGKSIYISGPTITVKIMRGRTS